jgi:serine/threonine protein kinase
LSPFKPESWQKNFSPFQCAPVASGGFATVFKAEHPETHEIIALKVSKIPMTEDDQMNLLNSRSFREIICVLHFNHPCILSIIGWNIRDHFLEIGIE